MNLLDNIVANVYQKWLLYTQCSVPLLHGKDKSFYCSSGLLGAYPLVIPDGLPPFNWNQ